MPHPTSSIKPRRTTIAGAPSWRIGSDLVEGFIAERGGHLAPVTFQTTNGPVQPFAIAPWAEETLDPDTPDLLKSLRGDFFCAPFGGNGAPWRGEQHPPHGETASSRWQSPKISAPAPGVHRFEATQLQTVRPGTAHKQIELRDGETNLYLRHTLSGMSGPMCPGHHAMIKCPDGEPGHIGLSPYRAGQVFPDQFEDPAIGGYSVLKSGAKFKDLREVPLLSGETTDITRYPARDGFEDLVMVSSRERTKPGWSTISFPEQGYLWFSLRDVNVIKSTILWMSNGGRHYAPWNGRHRRVIGIEDVTANFHYGLAESAEPNERSQRGLPTHLRLNPRKPTAVNYIMGVVPIPKNFNGVKSVRFAQTGVTFTAHNGEKVSHQVAHEFLANA
jgi:hypothetical protein